MPRPMPCPAPVTKATLPLNLPGLPTEESPPFRTLIDMLALPTLRRYHRAGPQVRSQSADPRLPSGGQ